MWLLICIFLLFLSIPDLSQTNTHIKLRQPLFCLDTKGQRSEGHKLTRSCRDLHSSAPKRGKTQRQTQRKCPPGALPLLCSSSPGRDIYQAKQTVHCKQFFQPSGPGHKGLVRRETQGVEVGVGGGHRWLHLEYVRVNPQCMTGQRSPGSTDQQAATSVADEKTPWTPGVGAESKSRRKRELQVSDSLCWSHNWVFELES